MEWRTKNKTGAFKWNKKFFPFNNSLKNIVKNSKNKKLKFE